MLIIQMVSYIETCEKAVREGGNTLVEMLGNVSVRLKSRADLVTDADLAAQKIITNSIHRAFPTHAILGEEDTGTNITCPIEAEFCWVIDPLDGTTNYAHNVPHFSVSVALLERGEPRVGCVFDPIRNELFSAEKGQGTRLNGKPIHTSNITAVADALAAIGFPPGVDQHSADLQAFLRAVPQFQAIRRTGSAALNLAYVAVGRFDTSWSYAAKIWDMAAGVLLVSEAGGVACSPWGGSLEVETGRFLASANDQLNQEVVRLLNTPPLATNG